MGSDDRPKGLAVDNADNIVVTGTCYTGVLVGDSYTAKYAATDGALLWERRYNASSNSLNAAAALALDDAASVIVTGTSYFDGVGDFYTAKYAAADGVLVWQQRFDGPKSNFGDTAQASAVDSSGDVIVTGFVSNTDHNSDLYTAKYAGTTSTLLWERRFNGSGNSDDLANALTIDRSGNVVVTGQSGGDYYTAKYAATNGALLWEKRYNGPQSGSEQARAVAVDSSGNVVVTGTSEDDFLTIKYAAADGAALWQKRYDGPLHIDDRAVAVAIDSQDNVVVTGPSGGAPFFRGFRGNGDYYTAKYAAEDGALLWEKRYNSADNSYDGASALALDANGNVIVTGASFSTTGRIDYYTAKYAAGDGALLWERRYNSSTNGHDEATAVTADRKGNVIVTGKSHNGSNYDFFTLKYADADGALLWEARYNGPDNSEDEPRAIAADDEGNVVVTGNSAGDFHTVKYSGTDGTALWEKRHAGSAVATLALGPDGTVAVGGARFTTIVYREKLPAVSIAREPTGVGLRFPGVPGRSHTIERGSNVTGPWEVIATATVPSSGILGYVDVNPPAKSAFYRMSTP